MDLLLKQLIYKLYTIDGKRDSAKPLLDALQKQANTDDQGASATTTLKALPPSARSAVYGMPDKDLVLDEAKVQAAIAKAKQHKDDPTDDKKRKYNSFATTDVTAEDMEAYRRTKITKDDPMAKFLQDGGGV